MRDKNNVQENESSEKLETEKLRNEILLLKLDIGLKEKELKRKTVLQPTVVTVLVAILGLIGAAITNFLQRSNQLEIEEKKFQYSVYQKALEAKDNVTAAKILDFYIKARLLPGEDGKYSKLLEEGNVDAVPTYGGMYENIAVPEINHSGKLSLVNDFITGKGTEYMLSYNAKERLEQDALTTIVLHCSFSPSLKGTATFLSDTIRGRSSAHLLIDRNGKVIQQVPFTFISYHSNKHYNKSSIGIELINYGELKRTDTGYVSVFRRKVTNTKVVCNNEGICWEEYSPAQIETAYKICKLLVSKYSIGNIVGHSEIDKGKPDPGPFFPLAKFKSLVRK
ncbi:MAG TPA: N-acetylmuramoyl-L-alanine amidase [Flavisolibacter sp.]|jgi:N-acetyl-anhydromuramyl-L-alanine amidase AmpD|nr:N-acetylmuramoyl-L-alanine amidase [Flavisolibacter sp.]